MPRQLITLALVLMAGWLMLAGGVQAQDTLTQQYDQNGIAFDYPADWEIVETTTDTDTPCVAVFINQAVDGEIEFYMLWIRVVDLPAYTIDFGGSTVFAHAISLAVYSTERTRESCELGTRDTITEGVELLRLVLQQQGTAEHGPDFIEIAGLESVTALTTATFEEQQHGMVQSTAIIDGQTLLLVDALWRVGPSTTVDDAFGTTTLNAMVQSITYNTDSATDTVINTELANVDFSGTWTGELVQPDGGISVNYAFFIDMQQVGDKVTGISRIETDDGRFADISFSGTVVDGVLIYNEGDVISQEISGNAFWCIKNGELTLDEANPNALSGTWAADNCPGTDGSITLTRSDDK